MQISPFPTHDPHSCAFGFYDKNGHLQGPYHAFSEAQRAAAVYWTNVIDFELPRIMTARDQLHQYQEQLQTQQRADEQATQQVVPEPAQPTAAEAPSTFYHSDQVADMLLRMDPYSPLDATTAAREVDRFTLDTLRDLSDAVPDQADFAQLIQNGENITVPAATIHNVIRLLDRLTTNR